MSFYLLRENMWRRSKEFEGPFDTLEKLKLCAQEHYWMNYRVVDGTEVEEVNPLEVVEVEAKEAAHK